MTVKSPQNMHFELAFEQELNQWEKEQLESEVSPSLFFPYGNVRNSQYAVTLPWKQSDINQKIKTYQTTVDQQLQ